MFTSLAARLMIVMIRRLLMVGALALSASAAWGATVFTESPFEPAFPGSSALGDAIVASAQGFESLYTNPAGFARGKPSFTILTAAPGLSPFPSQPVLTRLADAWATPGQAPSLLGFLLPAGLGGTAALGIGYSGAGLGLGLIAGARAYGTSSLAAQAGIAFVGGLGFNLGKHIAIGGDVRPLFRISVPKMSVSDLLTYLHHPASVTVPALYGFGVALDFGVIATSGPFRIGLAATDIAGTRMSYARESLGALSDSLINGSGIPAGEPVTGSYVVPMQVTAGIAYHPDLGGFSRFLDPMIELDYAYRVDPAAPLTVPDQTALLDGIRAGIDLRVFKVLHLLGGYQYGRLSGGAGLRLPGFHVDARVFEQIAASGVAGPRQGASAGISIRF